MKEKITKILWDTWNVEYKKNQNFSWDTLFDSAADNLTKEFEVNAPAYEIQKKLDAIKSIINESN